MTKDSVARLTGDFGVTEEDRERIRKFLRKRRHERHPDELLPSSNE